ncbi:hypothetical protein PAHAL_9G265800 [Panicum hallii]|jgi:hypothetical protein|uniref:Uncharacterized protein n=1 Tax=Panicum hallii TaxID=206008 RepID=A0A2T8I2M5_9POAL|nr:hypothetical protein PAHAL_9G265800 [Panicum hallii]
MASSSSASSIISFESETTREMTPEFDPIAAYEACAPLHWDAEEWDFQAWSEDDKSLTDGEDLQLLLDGELDEDNDDDMSSEGDFSTSEEEVDTPSTEEDSVAGGFLRGESSEDDDDDDDDEETEDSSGYSGDSGEDDGSDNDSSDDDSDASAAPPIKRHKVLGTYWW